MARDSLAGETLVYPGGSVKALDDAGRIGGHVVVFGGADVSSYRDVFTEETDYWLEEDGTRKSVLLYNHGMEPELGAVPIGDVEMKADKVGIWMEGQLKLRKAYLTKYAKHLKDIQAAVKSEDGLGLSSGSASHLVRRRANGDGTHTVLAWPIVEVSLTATPGEPRTRAASIKSLAEIKGEYLGATAEAEAALAAVERSFELARRKIGQHIGAGYFYEPMPPDRDPARRTPAERLAAIGGCLDELRATVLRFAGAGMEGAGSGEGSAAKAIARCDDLLSRLNG